MGKFFLKIRLSLLSGQTFSKWSEYCDPATFSYKKTSLFIHSLIIIILFSYIIYILTFNSFVFQTTLYRVFIHGSNKTVTYIFYIKITCNVTYKDSIYASKTIKALLRFDTINTNNLQ